MTNRQYDVDESFFGEIDTPEKAYVLGFVWGDGNIDKKHSMLRIEISFKDEEILNKIKTVMCSSHKIYHRVRSRNSTVTLSSTLVIGRKSIVNDLIKFGLDDNKNKSLLMPNISEIFFFDFIRGLYDSDGHIGVDNKNRVLCSLISTTNLCSTINGIFSRNGITSRLIKTNYEFLSRLVITKKIDAISLKEFIYKDASIFLDRKKAIFDKIHYKSAPDFSGFNNPFFGKHHSKETKNKLRKANFGEKSGMAKLNNDSVLQIRKMIKNGIKTKIISKQFNVKSGAIRAIARGDTWGHV